MKKGLKIGMLAMAFLAAMTTVISTGKVEAESDAFNIVEVSIGQYNAGGTLCTGTDYLFAFDSSVTVQTGVKTGNVSCIFGNQSATTVTYQLTGDLINNEDASIVIPKQNIRLKNGQWGALPVGLGNQPASNSFTELHTSPVTLFNKAGKMVGDASGTNLEIEITVPEGQPGGTYQGVIVLTTAFTSVNP